MKIKSLIEKRGITITVHRVDQNPNMPDSDHMDNWRIALKRPGGKIMGTYFSKGIGHKGAKPTVDEVLECLISDAWTVKNSNSFEDWAAELGYDEDSRKAEKTYKIIKKQSEELEDFLGMAIPEIEEEE